MVKAYNKINSLRKKFMEDNKDKSFAYVEGSNSVLISAPHGVNQMRLGRVKMSEIGSLALALYIAKMTGSSLIAKTRCDNDDVNFDERSSYKDRCYKVIKDKDIKYVLDFHGLSPKHGIDVNLGTHLGNNISSDMALFDRLEKSLKPYFNVSVDYPYMASAHTVSSSCKARFPKVWSLQIEVDYTITNSGDREGQLEKLIHLLIDFVKGLR